MNDKEYKKIKYIQGKQFFIYSFLCYELSMLGLLFFNSLLFIFNVFTHKNIISLIISILASFLILAQLEHQGDSYGLCSVNSYYLIDSKDSKKESRQRIVDIFLTKVSFWLTVTSFIVYFIF